MNKPEFDLFPEPLSKPLLEAVRGLISNWDR